MLELFGFMAIGAGFGTSGVKGAALLILGGLLLAVAYFPKSTP